MEIVQSGFKQLPVSGIAVEFQQAFKTGGHFVGFSIAEIGGFSACARLPEQVHGFRAAGIGEPPGECEEFLFSGHPGGKFDRAENGIGGHSVVPEPVAGTFPVRKTCNQIFRHAADRFKNAWIRFDAAVITAESEQGVFAPPDIPVGEPFFRRIGAETAVRFHAVAKPVYRLTDHRFEFRVGIGLQDADGGPDDLSPEFAAPAPVTVFVIAERAHEFPVIDFFQPVFRCEPDRFSESAIESNAPCRKCG